MKIKKYYPYLVIIGFGLILSLSLINLLPPTRVGDGSEYYALYYAWSEIHRPWMDTQAFGSYSSFIKSNQIIGLVSAETLEQAFFILKVGSTQDFNHFWFYSLLAYLLNIFLNFLQLNIGIHNSFIALHCLLLTLTASIAYRFQGKTGLYAFLILTFTTPLIWYLDKVHTEIFTYSFTLMGVILFISRQLPASSLMFSFAATQNPSFAIIAIGLITYQVLSKRKVQYSLFDLFFFSSAIFLSLLHPLYYFFRHGTATPQMLAGGASLGENIKYFYIWLLDPDVGLLPHWPIGLIYLLGISYLLFNNRKSLKLTHYQLIIFSFFFFIINIYAHSSTTNLNSGATPSLSRYALWYLPIFYPIILCTTTYFFDRKNFALANALTLLTLIFSIWNMIYYNPLKPEYYSSPSYLSSFIQKHIPNSYYPPIEIFAERFSGVGEAMYGDKPFAVVGPDCKKVSLLDTTNGKTVFSPIFCLYDTNRLYNLLKQHYYLKKDYTYIEISNDESMNSKVRMTAKTYDIGTKKEGNIILGHGWHGIEDWGVWSKDTTATLNFPCTLDQFYVKNRNLNLSLKLAPFSTARNIEIRFNEKILYTGLLASAELVNFDVPIENCDSRIIELELNLGKGTSPSELGYPNDHRSLGVSLTSYIIK